MNTVIAIAWILLCITDLTQGKLTGSMLFIGVSIFWGCFIISNSINDHKK